MNLLKLFKSVVTTLGVGRGKGWGSIAVFALLLTVGNGSQAGEETFWALARAYGGNPTYSIRKENDLKRCHLIALYVL